MARRSRRPIQAGIQSVTRGETAPSADAVDFREALSLWASGVAVLAVSDGEEIDALTVSAFSALSLDPPLVLLCVGEQTSILPMLLEERRFTISILAKHQRAIAGAIAQRLPGAESAFVSLADPSIRDALVAIACAVRNSHEGGDHRIVIGQVERVSFGPNADPLIYFGREYRSL